MQVHKPYEYTLNMETRFQENISKLQSFYCREDFESALWDFELAPEDAKAFKKQDLSQLCAARGIDVETLIADRSILESIPKRPEMMDALLESFYDMYKNSPDTKKIMERIVRMLAPEYAKDTVRVAILKKFVSGAGDNFKKFHTDSVLDWAEKQLGEEDKTKYEKLSPEEKKIYLLSKIDDSIFKYESVKLTSKEILKLIIDRIGKLQNDDDLDFNIDSTIYEQLKNLKELAESNKVDDKTFTDLVTKFERDFTNQLKKIKRVSKTGKMGTTFDLYKDAKKDALKAKKKNSKKNNIDYDLLEMCHDLAAGNFRPNGKTKVFLYYFAFMFGMILPIDDSQYELARAKYKRLERHPAAIELEELRKDYDRSVSEIKKRIGKERLKDTNMLVSYKREELYSLRRSLYEAVHCYQLSKIKGVELDSIDIDITKNNLEQVETFIKIKSITISLFQDYYNDNFLRLLSEDYMDPKNATSFEEAPTGEGINYKNFAEVIYIYFLCRDDLDMTPGEKIDKAEEIIDQCVKKSKEGQSILSSGGAYTVTYRKNMDVLFKKKIDELPEYILAHYQISSPDNNGSARIMIAAEEKTASGLIKEIKKDINEAYPDVEVFKVEDESKDDIAYERNKTFKWRVKELLEEKYANDKEFLKVLNAIDDRIHNINRHFDEKKRHTRNELIAYHLNSYIPLINETEGLDTFSDVFEDYAATINPFLEEARFQPLSEKNIFDMYVVISLYFYLVENNGYL